MFIIRKEKRPKAATEDPKKQFRKKNKLKKGRKNKTIKLKAVQ